MGDGDFQRELSILPCGPPFVTLREERSIIGDIRRPPCFPRPPPIPTYKKSDAEAFLERLWAFKRIKYLLAEDKDCTKALETTNKTCKEEAIELALEYNFVTEITSMVVEATDGYQGVEAPPEDDPFEGGPQLAFAAFAPQAAPPRPFSGGSGGIQKFKF